MPPVLRLIMLTLPLLLIVAALGYWQFLRPRPLVGGAILTSPQPAPDFQLTALLGNQLKLSQFAGKPVALTFLYTNCPDVCPIIASNLHAAYRQLGDQAKDVALVAVTVDPARDTQEQLKAFSDQRGLTNEWHFMTGSPADLSNIRRSYGILSQPYDSSGKPSTAAAQAADRGLLPTPDEVEHSAPIFLIDKHGAERAMMPVDVTPDTLVTNFRTLLAER